jgi:hypothetical protein
MNDNGKFQTLKITDKNEYVDPNAKSTALYCLRIVDTKGIYSDFSKPINPSKR